jgi:hypothetical protein
MNIYMLFSIYFGIILNAIVKFLNFKFELPRARAPFGVSTHSTDSYEHIILDVHNILIIS